MMERSPSGNLASSSSEEQRNGSIFKRMYNSLHRPKRGSDPMADIAEKFEQEKVREQRKKDVQQRPDHVKQRQHRTVNGSETSDGMAAIKSQSWRGDTKNTFDWDPNAKPDVSLTTSLPLPQGSTTESNPTSSPPAPSPAPTTSTAPKTITRGHSLTGNNSTLPPLRPTTGSRRFSLLTDSNSSSPPTNSSPTPSETDSQPKIRTDKSRSVPPRPSIPSFKEFRPEKREKVDMDELRTSYDQSAASPSPTNEPAPSTKEKKRNPSRNSIGPDKPMNGVVVMIASSRLPSTILPGLQLLPTDEVRKAPLNRPRHPYIPKKEPPASLFSGTLRSSSTGKHSPRKPSPAIDFGTRGKSAAIPIKSSNKDSVLTSSDSLVEPKVSPRSPDLPRSQTEVLTGAYPALRRQRSHHISNSPPSPRFSPPDTTSPIRDRPSSPTSSDESSIEGFVSIRRKPKTRNLKDSITPANRSMLKSKAAEAKKMKQQVVTAKDLAAFSQSEEKIKLEQIFESPSAGNAVNAPSTHTQRSQSTPSNNPLPDLSRRGLSSTSSPAHVPFPLPSPTTSEPKKAPNFARSTSHKVVGLSTLSTAPTFPSTPSTTLVRSSNSSAITPPAFMQSVTPATSKSPSPSPAFSSPSPTPSSLSPSPSPSPSPRAPTSPVPKKPPYSPSLSSAPSPYSPTIPTSSSTYPTSTPASPPYPKPPYIFTKTTSKSSLSLSAEIENEKTSPKTRSRAHSTSATVGRSAPQNDNKLRGTLPLV